MHRYVFIRKKHNTYEKIIVHFLVLLGGGFFFIVVGVFCFVGVFFHNLIVVFKLVVKLGFFLILGPLI